MGSLYRGFTVYIYTYIRRLTIDNPATDIPVPLVFRHEFQSTVLIFFFIYRLKGYWPRDYKNTLNKSLLSPDPVKRTVGEIEAGDGGVYVYVLIALYPESAVCKCLQQQTEIPFNLFGVIVKICCCIVSDDDDPDSLSAT